MEPYRPRIASAARTAILDVRDLVKVRIDTFGDAIKFPPFLAEFGRAVRGFQELATLPLDVVDDAFAVEAAMERDRDEAGLARHEPGAFLHERQGLILFARLGLDDGDLRNDAVVGLNLWHGAPLRARRRAA